MVRRPAWDLFLIAYVYIHNCMEGGNAWEQGQLDSSIARPVGSEGVHGNLTVYKHFRWLAHAANAESYT